MGGEQHFLGHPSVFWDGVNALSAAVAAVFVITTGGLAYRQIKIGVRTAELQGIQHMQGIVNDFSKRSEALYAKLSSETIASTAQFANKPPSPTASKHANKETPEPLTKAQLAAAKTIMQDADTAALVRDVIGKLNDLGQLLENGFLNHKMFFGKYHIMILRLTYMLEPVRQACDTGGNYGHRMLRLRYWALRYNRAMPKHRETDITIQVGVPRQEVVIVPALGRGAWYQRLAWYVQRRLYFR